MIAPEGKLILIPLLLLVLTGTGIQVYYPSEGLKWINLTLVMLTLVSLYFFPYTSFLEGEELVFRTYKIERNQKVLQNCNSSSKFDYFWFHFRPDIEGFGSKTAIFQILNRIIEQLPGLVRFSKCEKRVPHLPKRLCTKQKIVKLNN